jgi:hypothetical protein
MKLPKWSMDSLVAPIRRAWEWFVRLRARTPQPAPAAYDLEAFLSTKVEEQRQKLAKSSGSQTYLFRLQFRLGKRLTDTDPSVEMTIGGRVLKLRPKVDAGALKDSDELVILGEGFPDADSAQEFGVRLQRALALVAARRHLGTDIGHDPASRFQFGAAITDAAAAQGITIHSATDGLMVYPDDGSVLLMGMKMTAVVSTPVQPIISDLEALIDRAGKIEGVELDATLLLNAALMNSEPLAQLALSVAAVEMLAGRQKWSTAQLGALARLHELAKNLEGLTGSEYDEVLKASEGLRNFGVNESCRRLIRELGRDDLLPEWKRLYSARSQIFHGARYPTRQQIAEAAQLSKALAARIILAAAERFVPSATNGVEENYPIPEPTI